MRIGIITFFTFCSVVTLSAGPLEETVKAFERRPEYVRPFATIVGTMTNAGWYQSASVAKEFGFGISLPISVVYLSKADRQYSGTWTDDGCVACRSHSGAQCGACQATQNFTAPTIFGSIRAPQISRSVIDLNYNVVGQMPADPPFSDGVEELNALSALPYATLQATFFAWYTALTLRYMGIPEISGFGLQLPGVAIQHDFRHLFEQLPFSLSLAANFTFISASWTPGEDIVGKLKLNGMSNFLGILAGYSPKRFIEIFLEAGWDHSFLKPSGELIVDEEPVNPSATITGRNGFRAALNIAFPIGYHPVIGGIAGSQFGNSVTLFGYRSRPKENR